MEDARIRLRAGVAVEVMQFEGESGVVEVHAARCVRRRVAEGAEDGEAAARQVSVVTGLVLGRRAFVP